MTFFSLKKYFFVVFLVTVVTCQIKAQTSLRDFIQVEGTLKLEENNNVVNVSQNVANDPEGGFIVTDRAESQVRLYDKKGKLKEYFGQAGKGPGDFQYVMKTVRLPSRNLLTIELLGRISIFNTTGDSLKSNYLSSFIRLTDVKVIDEHTVLLVGYDARKQNPFLLHLYDFNKKKVTKSFFPLPQKIGTYGGLMASISKLGVADVYDNAIIATDAIHNQFYVFNTKGKLIKKFSVPLKDFRFIKSSSHHTHSPRSVMTTFSMIDTIAWIHKNMFLIQFTDLLNTQTGEAKEHWVLANMKGHVLWEIMGSPRFITNNASRIYFQNFNKTTAQKWLFGIIK